MAWYVIPRLNARLLIRHPQVYGWWVVFNYLNDAKHWSDMGKLRLQGRDICIILTTVSRSIVANTAFLLSDRPFARICSILSA